MLSISFGARPATCSDNQASVYLLTGLSHLAQERSEEAVQFFKPSNCSG